MQLHLLADVAPALFAFEFSLAYLLRLWVFVSIFFCF